MTRRPRLGYVPGAKATVNGKQFEIQRMKPTDVRVGVMVNEAEHQRSFRIVALDGEDVVLRDMRRPDHAVAAPLDGFCKEYVRLVPVRL